jgi:hypothetical protein
MEDIVGSTKRRYRKEDFARRGDTIYENEVHPQLTADDKGKFAAIDIETGSYDIAVNELADSVSEVLFFDGVEVDN